MLAENTRKLEESELQRIEVEQQLVLAEAECSNAKRARMEADVKLNKAEHARLDAVSVAVDAMCNLKHKTVDLAKAEEKIAVVEFDLIENKTKLKKSEKALTTWASSHGFTMLRLNSKAAPLPYYVIRCLNDLMQESILKIRSKYPNSIMIYQQSAMPNGINLFKHLIQTGKITRKGNYCVPLGHAQETRWRS